MKIARVETFPVKRDLKEPFGAAYGWTKARQYLVLRIVAEDGTSGYGECWGPIAGNEQFVQRFIAPLIIGQSAIATTRVWEQVRFKLDRIYKSSAPYGALGGIDIALWDLKGKLLDQPIHELLGGAYHETIPAYATGHYFRDVSTLKEQISAVLEEANGHIENGFNGLKLKLGLAAVGWDVKADIALMRALREEVGAEISLMIDANCTYSVPEALEVGRAAEELEIVWFEEPLPPEDLDGYRQLTDKLEVPVAAGESWGLLSQFHHIFDRRAVSIAQPDVCSSGGITEVRRIADLAHVLNIPCIPHVYGTPIVLAAALHVLATIPSHARLEYDQSDNPIREALLPQELRLHADSTVSVPTGPGLGIEVDEARLEHLRP